MTAITLIVPVAPVPKARARTVNPNGRRTMTYTPPATVAAEQTIGEHWRAAYGARKPRARHIPLTVTVVAYLARPEHQRPRLVWPTVRPDADNYGKLALDALNKLAWEDDAQVVRMTVVKRYDDNPRWEITICEQEEA